MGRDRRYHTRIIINLDAVLYINTKDLDDLDCKVINISEEGACFEVAKEYDSYFQVGDTFKFSMYDMSMKQVGLENELIVGSAVIKRKAEVNDNIQLGCVVRSTDLVDYIRYKTVYYTIKAHT